MRFIVVLALAITALVLIKLKKQYRMHITECFLLVIIALNIAYNRYAIYSIMPFFRPTNQLTYQPEYQDRKEFPDALLPLVIKNKTVYVKDDYLYDIDTVVDSGFNWMYTYFHYNGTVNYANGIGAEVIPDEKLNEVYITKEMLSDFIDIGYANDMYRNTNMYSGYDVTDLNYFGHYWYYNAMNAPMHMYINIDGLYDSDELVWIWQPISATHEPEEWEKSLQCYDETEYMFIMSKDYYDSKFVVNT